MSVVDTLKETGKKIGRALSDAEPDDDILETLKREHEEVKDLLGQLTESESAASRKSLLKKIKAALVPHSRAEEKIVYDAILALKGKQPRIDGEEGYFEHSLADKMLANLSKIVNATSPEFSAGAKVLKELVEHHVEEEERNVWKDVRENFSDEDRAGMDTAYKAAKKKVKVT
ncbi:MAG TPA: hemerythrin domain-containing protein [Rhizomicrobium sp.]|jgi:hemerythrin-like domain-containing protein|nr:hemerythrin domain-containing protein [Rhizomicrobium sp.]